MTLRLGKTIKVSTARGSVVTARFAIIDSTSVVISHDPLSLQANDGYPAELQPRDRGRICSEIQIEGISRNLRPELLGESLTVTEGAPIVGPDLIVESGNARAIAILRAYSRGDQCAKRYRQFLVANAGDLGLAVKGMPANPVLVRVRQTRVDRYEFVVEANESGTAAMSDAEQARIDARRIDAAMLAIFRPTDEATNSNKGTDLLAPSNIDFVKLFFNSVVAPAERGRYIDSSGLVSQQGAKRIRNAILAKAFCETAEGFWAIERIAESLDNNVRIISNTLLLKAAKFVAFKAAAASGHRHSLDITGDIVKALRTFSDLKVKGMAVDHYLAQGNMLGEAPDLLQGLILRSLDIGTAKRTDLDEIFDTFLRKANAAGNPNQLRLTSRPEPAKLEIFQEAFDEFKREKALLEKPKVKTVKTKRRRKTALQEAA